MEQGRAVSSGRRWALIAIIGIVAAGIAGLRLSEKRLQAVVKTEADRTIAMYSAFVTIGYDRISVGLLDRAIHVTDITVKPRGTDIPVRIGELVVHRVEGGNRVPHRLVLSIKSLVWPGLNAYMADVLPGIRLPVGESVEVDLFCDYDYDPERHRFTIRQLTLRAPDAGTVSLAAGIGNFVAENAALYLLMPHAILFEGLSLVYTDDSMVSRWIAAGAAEEGISPEAFALRVQEDLVRRAITARQEGKPGIADALEEMAHFLGRPGHLTLAARPENPVPLGSLMRVTAFEEFVDLLDVRMAANRF